MGWNLCCGTGRRFLTRQERIERLQAYAERLERELQAVEERIEEIEA